jgi:hypothetical protein
MNQYLLLLHETPADYAGITPAEMQELVQRYSAWAQDLGRRGLLAGGHKLTDDGGRLLRIASGSPLVSDGPYAEAKDVVGGIFIINAESDGAAEALATTCPHLYGRNWIELRRIDPV